ncbi:DUF6371 domain-containing protein [Flectobacillus longus]|uniref:DUF6371 domain-containing protein n=1 Tax=Flectobacillus longus TaxID=2984207 RepID=UPI0024B7D9E4|nr:DUF6371 domain-containing protein [Flectobacillus longus]MDI9878059.1 DUF6371 domain-containing protein [Flectobacillus longus]
MNGKYRFILDKSSKKFFCNWCKSQTLVRYLDTQTGDYLPPEFGRCDKEVKCGYHLNPYIEGYSKQVTSLEYTNYQIPQKPVRVNQKEQTQTQEVILFDWDSFLETLVKNGYTENNFIQNLLQNVPFPFLKEDVAEVIKLYRLGTITKGYRRGATTFPFIDSEGGVRAIQVKQFDNLNHTLPRGTDFLHSMLHREYDLKKIEYPNWLKEYLTQDKKVSCLFGEHLLKMFPQNPIALVEAPKTAIYGTLYFGLPHSYHDLVWLAVYNKSSFSFEKLRSLRGRNVLVFPDLSQHGKTFKEWNDKAENIKKQYPDIKFSFSDFLEKRAIEEDKIKGLDLADYLIKYDWRLFRESPFCNTFLNNLG